MTLTFRENIGLFTGKGSALTTSEFDDNTHTLHIRIKAIEDDPPEAISVEGFELSGSQFYWNLTDSTQLGPFTFPVVAVGSAPWRLVEDPVYAPVAADYGRMLRCASGCTIILPSGLFPDATEIHFLQASASPIVFETDSDGTVRPPDGDDSRTARQGAVATAKWWEATGYWEIWGDLAAVSA